MKRNLNPFIFCIIMALLVTSPAPAGKKTALITNLKGDVKVVSGSQPRKARLVMELNMNDTVTTGSSGEVTVTYYSSGNLEKYGANSEFQIGEDRGILRKGASPRVAKAGKVSTATMNRSSGFRDTSEVSHNVVVVRGDSITYLHPLNNSTIMQKNPRFSYQPMEGAVKYRIYVTDRAEGKKVWESETRETSLECLNSLIPGGDYLWKVTALDSAGDMLNMGQEPVKFSILNEKDTEEIREVQKWAKEETAKDPGDISPRLMEINLYAEKGLTGEIVSTYEEILKKNPDMDEIRERLGSIYAEQGMLVQAMDQCEAILKNNPENCELYNRLEKVFNEKRLDGSLQKKFEEIRKIHSQKRNGIR